MEKKYVKVNFALENSKKRSVTVKTIQKEAKDEYLKSLADFIQNFIEGKRENIVKVVETTLE